MGYKYINFRSESIRRLTVYNKQFFYESIYFWTNFIKNANENG